MQTRYEVIDGVITKIDETRTAFAQERAAKALNELIAQIVAMCAKDGTEHAQQAVTPEWLAKTIREELVKTNRYVHVEWDELSGDYQRDMIAAAANVLKQMPSVMVDWAQFLRDYDKAPRGDWRGSIKYALEAQGVRCK